jgi:hypothetical protein
VEDMIMDTTTDTAMEPMTMAHMIIMSTSTQITRKQRENNPLKKDLLLHMNMKSIITLMITLIHMTTRSITTRMLMIMVIARRRKQPTT